MRRPSPRLTLTYTLVPYSTLFRSGRGEVRDQRFLAKEGRLARHVGTGDEPEAPFRPEVAIVGDEASGVRRLQRLLDHGMPPAGDREAEGGIDDRAAVVALRRELGDRKSTRLNSSH